jgi:AAA ATPase domain
VVVGRAPRSDFASGRLEPFVGRDGALDALLSFVQQATEGHGAVALIAGEPGIGKTRLVEEVTARAGVPVRWATCWEGEGTPAYWPWEQLLRPMIGDVDAVDPAVAEALRTWLDGGLDGGSDGGAGAGSPDRQRDPAEARFRFFDAVGRCLAAASGAGPLVLVVDDLHWADPASIRLLEFLARDRRARRTAIMCTYRDSELGDGHPLAGALGDLVRDGVHVRLEGLGEHDVATLAHALGGDALDLPSARRLHRQSAGNPFYVRELVRLLGGAGSGAPVRAASIPATVRAVVGRRLDLLSPATVELLVTAAVIGADFDIDVLCAVTGLDAAEAGSLLDEARLAGLVVDDSAARRCSFVHALVREVLYDRLGPAARARQHELVGRAIRQQAGASRVTEVAHHVLQAAAGRSDGDAVAWAIRAAEHCHGALAYEDAAVWYGRALELLSPDDRAGEGDLLVRRGEVAVAAGDLPAGRESFRQAAVVARERGDVALFARAALGFGSGAGGFEIPLHDDVQIGLLEEAVDNVGPDATPLRVSLLARLSVALTHRGVDERRRALSEEAIGAARKVGEPAALGYALASHCDVIAGPGWCELRLDEATEVVDLARQAGDRHLELLGRRLRLVALLELGEIGAADVERARFAQVADAVRQPLHRWYVPLWNGMRALMRGDVAAAAGCCSEAEELGRLAGSENAVALTFTQRWVLMRYEGRFVDAARALEELLTALSVVVPTGMPGFEAMIATHLGDQARASASINQWMRAGLHDRPHDSEWLPEMAQLAEVAATVGAVDVAEALLERLRPYAHRICVEGIGAVVTGSAAWYVAMLARCVGRDAEADELEAAARDAHRRIGLAGDPPPLAPPTASRPASTGPTTRHEPQSVASQIVASLVHEGATWAVTFAGSTRRLRDSKGVRDLAVLLARPDSEVHCLELAGGNDVGADTGPALDTRARREYEERIRELQGDIDEARDANDFVRAERAEAELDALVQQLTTAFGLGGRSRQTGSAAERARSTVTSRIRAAIKQSRDAHPDLARHLENSVHTGVWCAYRPERPITWQVESDR